MRKKYDVVAYILPAYTEDEPRTRSRLSGIWVPIWLKKSKTVDMALI